MPVTLDGHLPVSSEEAEKLWGAVRQQCSVADDTITVRVVTAEESQRLKREYKKIDEPTNVLTFSYGAEHDIALCLEVARKEAQERGVLLRNYVAWLLVHAYLHATGLDHEASEAKADTMRSLEHAVLQDNSFTPYE